MSMTKVATKPLRNRMDAKQTLLKAIDIELNSMKKALAEIRGLDQI